MNWRKKYNLFLWIYFWASFVLLCFLMTDRLYNIENQNREEVSSLLNIELLKYQKQLINHDCLTCVYNEHKFNVTLESVKHLRRTHTTAQEVFNYLSITLNKTNINKVLKNEILSEVSDLKNVIQLEVEKASESLGINNFKNYRLTELSKLIHSRIHKLQNPPKHLCPIVPKLICKLSVDAGFASGIHEILWCLLSAYYNNQTVILISDWTKYFGRTPDVWERAFSSLFTSQSREHWNNIFIPLSTTCDYKDLPKEQLNEMERPNTVIHRKLMNQLPKSFGSELMDLVDNPNSWFHSQFIGYILRPKERLQTFLKDFKIQNNFNSPVVGLQVRRSDKVMTGEALYHPLSDYMIHVKDYFDKLELTQTLSQRLVYVASDDPSVLPQLKTEFPNYKFIGSVLSAKIAFSQSTRYSNASLWGILTDIFLLSQTDYIVCTFSSAICRLSYQLMRFNQLDASFKYRSLDVPFHYHHSLTPVRTVFYNHLAKSSNQWDLKIGDHLHERIRGRFTEWFDQAINGRGWDSYFFASNSSQQRFYKLYPIYKVYDDIELV